MNREHKKPIVKSTKVKKEPVGRKLLGMFFTSDFDSVKKWVIEDKIIPGAKNLFLDTLSMMLTGDSRYRSSSSRTNYNKIMVGTRDERSDRVEVRRRSRNDYRDIVFESIEDAMDVVDALKGDLERFDRGVSILDLADYADRANMFNDTDDNYGWRELPNPTRDYIIQTSQGYELRLPPVVVLPR